MTSSAATDGHLGEQIPPKHGRSIERLARL
jgi:hypothetical protein